MLARDPAAAEEAVLEAGAPEADARDGASAPSRWAIVEIAPDALPAPLDGYVDLFEGEEPPALAHPAGAAAPTGEAPSAAAPQTPGDAPAPPPRLPPGASGGGSTPRPRLLGPEVLLVVAFLATGAAVAAVAARLAPGPLASSATDVLPPPTAVAAPERDRRPQRAQRPRQPAPTRAAPRPVAAAPEPGPEPSAGGGEALPPAPAPEPAPVHDAAAVAPHPALPALQSRAAVVAEQTAAGAALARRPRLADPGCLAARLRGAPPRGGAGTATVRIAVDAEGTASGFELLSGSTDPQVEAALRAAVEGCRFVPAADAAGHPVPASHVLAIDSVGR